jgi:transposase
MITPPPGARVWLAVGVTDMRKGFDGLAMLVQEKLQRDPFGGQIFVFRGRRGYLLKALWWDGQGLCLFGLRRRTEALWSPPRSLPCCWKASIGGCRCARGSRRLRDSRDLLTQMLRAA